MSTGEGPDPRGGPPPRDRDDPNDRSRRGDIGVGGGDDSVSRIQLAARWAEAYGKDGDSLTSALKRFRTAYDYLDAVIHGVDPPQLDAEAAEAAPERESAAPPQWSRPTEQGPTQPAPPPPSEPRPWS
jgi:hypothetical protein